MKYGSKVSGEYKICYVASLTFGVIILLCPKYINTEGNANPQEHTDPKFRVNIVFIMLDTSKIHFVRLQHMPKLNT